MTTKSGGGDLFLGLDASTQTLKAVLVDREFNVIADEAINFDHALPEFQTQGGVHRHPDGLTVTSPAIMWVAALDLLLAAMQAKKWPLNRVAAMSGSGQQHGSVWLRKKARSVLRLLDSRRPLRSQLESVFTVEDSPIWMDSSTRRQCLALERALGGPQAVARLTGSRAYERFTANQIAKIHATRPQVYAETDRIALVSSFMAALFMGDYAPLDAADASGMNLMNVRTKKWAPAALRATAPGLELKLGRIVPSHRVIGTVQTYYAERYGFNPGCLVAAFSGDNPCSLAGLRLQRPGDVAISLGTSDTVFGSLRVCRPSASEGHIFANPVDPRGYMALICFKNGSLTREFVRDMAADKSWEVFARLLAMTPAGNDGRIGFYIRDPEITPPIFKPGIYRFDSRGRRVKTFPPEAEVRAVLEGQFLAMRLHGANLGLRPTNILATGGASVNPAVLKVMSDVFGVPVFVGEQPNSAAVGAAYRALHAWVCRRRGRFVPFAEVMRDAPPFSKAADPDPRAQQVYRAMLRRYAELEKKLVDAK